MKKGDKCLKESDISWNDYLVLKLYVTAKRRNRFALGGKRAEKIEEVVVLPWIGAGLQSVFECLLG